MGTKAQGKGPDIAFANDRTVSVIVRGGLVRIRFGASMAEVSPADAEAFGLKIIQVARSAPAMGSSLWVSVDRN